LFHSTISNKAKNQNKNEWKYKTENHSRWASGYRSETPLGYSPHCFQLTVFHVFFDFSLLPYAIPLIIIPNRYDDYSYRYFIFINRVPKINLKEIVSFNFQLLNL
jgi:hypothetical protein